MPRVLGRRLSVTAFGLALLCASAWWGAYSAMVVLHSDAKFTAALTRYLDRPEVRSQVVRWTTRAIDSASTLSGAALSKQPVVRQLQAAITSPQDVAPMSNALVAAGIGVRDATVSQLDSKASPKQAVRLDLGPVFSVAKIKLSHRDARLLGLQVKQRAITTPLLSSDQLDALQRRYNVTRLVSRWAGWIGLALLAISVAASAKPLRTLALAGAAVAVLATLAPLALARAAAWAAGSDLASSLQPVLVVASQNAEHLSWPLVIAGALATLAFGFGHYLRRARARDEVI